jgi:hypothetical protein
VLPVCFVFELPNQTQKPETFKGQASDANVAPLRNSGMRVFIVTFDEAGDDASLKAAGVAMAGYLQTDSISSVCCSPAPGPGALHLAKLIGNNRLKHSYVSVRKWCRPM